jgi:hypothetical protein
VKKNFWKNSKKIIFFLAPHDVEVKIGREVPFTEKTGKKPFFRK